MRSLSVRWQCEAEDVTTCLATLAGSPASSTAGSRCADCPGACTAP